MISYPKPGDRVELHYRDHSFFRHLQVGEILIPGKGPGPINHLVLLDNGEKVVVPRGNLFKEKYGQKLKDDFQGR